MQGFIGKGDACWVQFKEAFWDQWVLPIGLVVREANIWTKRADKTFLEFFFAKLALVRSAYPQNPMEAHIEMIKYCLDNPHAAGWAKEPRSLSVFEAELRDYDNYLRRYSTLLSGSREKSIPGYMAPQKVAMLSRPPLNMTRVKRSPEEIQSQNKEQAASLAVRTNDKGKKMMLFRREDGTLVFLRDPC